MNIIKIIKDTHAEADRFRSTGKRIELVPTMDFFSVLQVLPPLRHTGFYAEA